MIIEKDLILNGVKTNYTINTKGEIFSLNYNKTKQKRKLKQFPDKDGYMKVTLHIDGKQYSLSVARLVAQSFIHNDDPINKTQVNHKDGMKKHINDISNLEWVTPQENIIHAYKHGLAKVLHGKDTSNNKYGEDVIHKICKEFVKNKLTVNEISKKFNVPNTLVQSILYHRTWKHISSMYDFSNYNKTKKITEKQVERICVLLESQKYSLVQIALKMNVPFHIVKSIYYKQTWKHVSINYSF